LTDKATDREAADNALCGGLKDPVDDLADAIIINQKETPAQVIVTGTRVIKGYDSEC